MKIDDIIRKCIEMPGISIKRSDFSTELLLKEKEGKGSMTFFPLFPGVTIAYIFVNSPTWTAPNFREDSSIEKGPLLLNYCVTGRCEIILNNENFVYVKDGEISLTERFAQKQYVYPRRIYEGMEFFIDGYACSSDVRWGPRFVVGRRVKFDGKRMFIETPLDASVCDNLVLRQYCEIPFHRGMADAVINLDGLRQLWPVCENSRSELIKFLTRTAREQYTIKRR